MGVRFFVSQTNQSLSNTWELLFGKERKGKMNPGESLWLGEKQQMPLFQLI